MGMFDSFIFPNTSCPHCGFKSSIELQTKLFECGLKQWKQGSDFESECVRIYEGIVKNCYGWNCNKCDGKLEGDVVISQGTVKYIVWKTTDEENKEW